MTVNAIDNVIWDDEPSRSTTTTDTGVIGPWAFLAFVIVLLMAAAAAGC